MAQAEQHTPGIVERLRRTKTERLMRSAFGGIMLDMEEERQAPVNPDGPEAADLFSELLQAVDAMIQAEISGSGASMAKARHRARATIAKATGASS